MSLTILDYINNAIDAGFSISLNGTPEGYSITIEGNESESYPTIDLLVEGELLSDVYNSLEEAIEGIY